MHVLKQLIARGESQTLEFKFELNSARKIAATLSAFSNSDGGTLLIGVKDNGGIAGIRLEEELYVLDAAATMYCKPPVNLENKRWEVDGKFILEAKVPASNERPVKAESEPGQWKAFLRSGASNRLASPVHLELWQLTDPEKEKPSAFTEKQQKVLKAFQEKKWLSLNQATRITKLQRHIVAKTLANFLRWNLIEWEPEEGGGFVFVLTEDE